MMGGGGGDFFGSEILVKSNFFWSMNDVRIFLGHKEKYRDFVGYAIKSSDFFG